MEEFGWPGDALVIGWIGNFWGRKRPSFFLAVAAALAKTNPRYRFVMFGRDGDFSIADVKKQANDLGIGGVTAVPGFRQPVEANLACLDLMLAPAPNEPFGRALVEAIILGTPVVATRGAGHSEIIGAWGGGLLAEKSATAADVAKLCETALAAPEGYTVKPERAAEIAAELSSEIYADRMLGIYGKISMPSQQRDLEARDCSGPTPIKSETSRVA
ncbi:MAG: glycosyltransferase [Hyphomonadaceae bacterium]|nr:glycosyltransferase [Hyphomonadaceae bacterium]